MDPHVMLYVGGYWVFSAVVGGMVEPTQHDSRAYKWVYNSLHILAGNMAKAVAAKYPEGSIVAEKTESLTITEGQK